jgi:hypothetical protein
MIETETGVIEAAQRWLLAKEALLAAEEKQGAVEEAVREFDDAEVELTAAVYRFLGRHPAIPGPS